MKSITLKHEIKRSLTWALLFQVVWIGSAILALTTGLHVKTGLIIGVMPLLWAPALLERITGVSFPLSLQLHYFLFITASSVAGTAFGVYGIVPHWDSVVHCYSGFIFAWLAMYTIRRLEQKLYVRVPRWFAFLAALVTPLASAAVWEIGEYTSDYFFHTASQAGLTDTISDMAFAGAGAVIATLLAVRLAIPLAVVPRAFGEE